MAGEGRSRVKDFKTAPTVGFWLESRNTVVGDTERS